MMMRCSRLSPASLNVRQKSWRNCQNLLSGESVSSVREQACRLQPSVWKSRVNSTRYPIASHAYKSRYQKSNILEITESFESLTRSPVQQLDRKFGLGLAWLRPLWMRKQTYRRHDGTVCS